MNNTSTENTSEEHHQLKVEESVSLYEEYLSVIFHCLLYFALLTHRNELL